MSLIFRTNNSSGNALPATMQYFNYFSPSNITGCCLWLDSQDNSTFTFSSGSNIATWLDKSGVGNNATGVSSPVLTANLINGKQAIATATGPYFTGSISITGNTVTTFAVALTTASLPLGGSDQRLVSLVSGGGVDYGTQNGTIALFNQGNSSWIGTWRVSGPIANSGITQNVPFLACSKYDGTNGFLWKNGSPGSIASSASSGNFNVTKYGIGNLANPTSEFWRGYIGEVIIYNTALSDTDRRNVEGYLAQKWGLTASLIAGHPGLTQSLPLGKPGTLAVTIIAAVNIIVVSANLLQNLDAASYSSGSTWTALVGSNYTVSGTLTTVATPGGPNAAVFSGSAYAQDLTGITTSTMYSYTIDVWFYAAASATGTIVGELGQASLGGWNVKLVNIESGSITVGFWQGSVYSLSLGAYTANTWTHVSYTYNYSTNAVIGYVNGVYVSTGTATKQWPATTYISIGGSANPTPNFTGRIGAFKLYNTILNATQITQNYNALKNRFT